MYAISMNTFGPDQTSFLTCQTLRDGTDHSHFFDTKLAEELFFAQLDV
jgi:hypothetical protein